ncbi:MAG: phytanoyl-CoA dioxygenase family protein [Rhodospirillales bacterium]
MLTADEIAAYADQGFVVPAMRLDAARVDALRGTLDRLIAANPHIRPERLVSAHIEGENAEGVKGSADFLDLARDPAIVAAVSQLVGADVILWGCQIFCKPGGDGMEVPWHQDGHYWPIRPLATVTAWIAIDDVNVENSCLRVIPGSHRDRVSYAHDVDNSDTIILNQVLKPEHLQSAPPRDIELSPGRFSIHDVYLIHGANPNNSGKRRAGMVFRYMPASSHFDREMAARQVRDMGVLDLSRRKLHLVRGVDRSRRNDIAR